MKILQVVHSLLFSAGAGTQIYTRDLSVELSKGHDVFIFCRVSDRKQKDYEITEKSFGKIKVYMINNTFRQCESFEMYYENKEIDSKFALLLDEIRPDIVHIQHLVFLSTGLVKKIKEKGIPIVFTLHDYWLACPRWHIFKEDGSPCKQAFSGKPCFECLDCLQDMLNIKKEAMRFYAAARRVLPGFVLDLARKAYSSYIKKISDNGEGIVRLKRRVLMIKDILETVDLFLSPSDFLRDKFIEFGIPSEKITLVRNGLGSSLFRGPEKSKAGRIRFVFIGTILPAKGLHILIEAFNKISPKEAELKIYGKLYPYAGAEYYLPYLKKIAKNKNISFMGGFDHNDLQHILKETDAVIVPSLWYENSPLVIQEAFLSKTPVIASRIAGIPELVIDRLNGLLFEPGNTADLREKIDSIIKNHNIIDELRRNIPEIKDIKNNASEIEVIYERLAGKDKVYDLLKV